MDDEIWQWIVDIEKLVHHGDRIAFSHAYNRLTRAISLSQLAEAGLYLYYLLRYQVAVSAST